MFNLFCAKKGFLAFVCLLAFAYEVNAFTLIDNKAETINFTKNTSFTLAPDKNHRYLRINEHEQITFLEIKGATSQYFYDTYNAFPYYEVLIPAHDEPLSITVHTFLLNELTNQITVTLSEPQTPSKKELAGHKALTKGFTIMIENYLKRDVKNDSKPYFKKAYDLFLQEKNHFWAGISINQLAQTISYKDDAESKSQYFNEAIVQFIKSGHEKHRWFSENRLGLIEWRMNQIEQAKNRFLNVAQHADSLQLNKLSINGYNNLGLMEWEQRNIYPAIEAFKKCLEIMGLTEDALISEQLEKLKINDLPTLNNLALAYQNLGQLKKAKQLFLANIQAARNLNDLRHEVKGLSSLANILIEQSQFDEAQIILNQTKHDKFTINTPHWWKIQIQIQFGRIYHHLSMPDLSANHYLNALELADTQKYKSHRINTLLKLHELNPNDPQSETWLAEAQALVNGANLPRYEAKIYRLLAAQQNSLESHEATEQLLLKAQEILIKKHQIIGHAQTTLQLAQLYQRKKSHNKALSILNPLIESLPQGIDKLLVSQIYNSIAYNQWKAGNKAKALVSIKQSIDQLQVLSQHVSHSKTQQQLKLHVDETLTLYSMLFAKAQNPAQTVAFIHNTQQAWQNTQSDSTSGDINKQRAVELVKRIGDISFALENNRLSDETRDTMEREIISLNNELDYLSTINKAESPNIDIPALQKTLGTDELIIQFMTGQYGSIAWWISQDEIKCMPLENREKLATWVEHTRQTIADRAKLNQDIIKLTEHLFSPLVDYPKATKLNLILDEPLNVLPIAVLPLPGETASMIDRYTIKTHSQLAFIEKTQSNKWHAIYFANPVHHHKDQRLPEGTSNDGITEFSPLTGTAREVANISQIIPGQTLAGFDANKTHFTEAKLGAVDNGLNTNQSKINHSHILHMATHAFFNETRPDLSALVLSAYDPQGNKQASMVRASEIRNMDLPHKLVVLSGCETGLSSGNGLTGLTQSFLQAGAKNIISSLWQVDDRVTSQMMTLFYQNLDKGQNIPEALRHAQIHIKNQHRTRHPKFWGGWFHISN